MADTTDRLDVLKTFKLYVDGKFPRSESGRSIEILRRDGGVLAHVCRASRKDMRDAVEAARKAQPAWQDATPYLRGQILYRLAEMIQGKAREFAELIESVSTVPSAIVAAARAPAPKIAKSSKAAKPAKPAKIADRSRGARSSRIDGAREVAATVDRLVAYAGWADKYAQVLGCNNPVAGPYYNFTIPEPTGVVGVIAPDEPSLLGLVSLLAPAICSGNAVVALASQTNPLPAAVLGEACATGDLPGGVVNLLTGMRDELLPFFASHRDIEAIVAAGGPSIGGVSDEQASLLRAGASENVKRVTIRTDVDFFDSRACEHPWCIEPTVEMKTVWHPSAM
jgi:acyl-CoA reductase-like NAD-dependent aldehyde dehydrogenase